MERYIRDISHSKAPDSSIIISGIDVVEKDYKKSIVLIPDHFNSCPSISELLNALSKRLRTSQLCSIAIGCICSYGYTMNHNNVSAYSSKVFASVWGHLETLRTSSSGELSRWLSTCLDQRSQEGYTFRFNEESLICGKSNSTASSVPRKRFNVKVESIGSVFAEMYFGDVITLRDAMVADTKMLSAIKFVFNEPVLTNDSITYGQRE